MIKTLQQALKMDREKFKVPRSVQQAIPIQRIWPDGVFQSGTKFSKSFRFSDINYAIASKEDKTEMFLDYSELLNALDSGASAKITLNNRRINKEEFEASLLLPMKEDGLDTYRKEYNEMLLSKVSGTNNSTGIGLFSVPEDLAKQLYPDIKNMEQVWNVFTDEDTDTLRKELYALLDDPLLNIISRSDYAEQLEAQFKNIMMFIYGLLAFLFFFSLVNLINTLMTNLIARQQEFGILQSVGLSDKQLSKMLTMECFCYVAVTLLITLIVGGLAGFLLVIILGKTEIFGQLVYQFPIWELLVFAVLLMFVQALYSIYAIRSIRKQSLVERIKIKEEGGGRL